MLDWFANLWEIDKGEYWGYVTTGGTEGNLHGILTGSVLLNLEPFHVLQIVSIPNIMIY